MVVEGKDDAVEDKVEGKGRMPSTEFEAIIGRFIDACSTTFEKNLAEFLGVDESSITTARRKGKIPSAWYFRISEKTGFALDWLRFGRGPKKHDLVYEIQGSETVYVRSHPPAPYLAASTLDPEAFDLVPMAEAQLSAGGGAVVLSENAREFYAFRREWLSRIATSRSALMLMAVVGDSMAPGIRAGDIVMIDQGRKAVYDGLVYAIGQGDLIFIKKLQPLPGSRLRILSDNPEVPEYSAAAEEIRIIGQVIWHARELVR